MVTFLNVSAIGKNNLLKAEFYRIHPNKKKLKDIFGKPYKEIEGDPVELVVGVLKELQSRNIALRISSFMPDVPPDIQVLLNKSLMSYYRVKLPVHSTVIKLEKDKTRKEHIVAVIYDEQNENHIGDFPPDVAIEKGKPLEVASKVLDFLNCSYWHEAKLEFEDGVGEDIKNLFAEVINLYNQSVNSK